LIDEQNKIQEVARQEAEKDKEAAKLITDKRKEFLDSLDKSENIMEDLNLVADHLKE